MAAWACCTAGSSRGQEKYLISPMLCFVSPSPSPPFQVLGHSLSAEITGSPHVPKCRSGHCGHLVPVAALCRALPQLLPDNPLPWCAHLCPHLGGPAPKGSGHPHLCVWIPAARDRGEPGLHQDHQVLVDLCRPHRKSLRISESQA